MKTLPDHRDPFHPVEGGGLPGGWRARVHEIIFGIDTPAGRAFDIGLVAAILLSILVVVLDSVPAVGARYPGAMAAFEWFFTLLFTAEYAARLVTVRHPLRYAVSFYGLIDLLSVLPAYVSLLLPGSEALIDIRILRLLRVFRIFKLTLYIEETTRLGEALAASRRKIMVFISVVLMAVLILGTVMYVIEGPEHGYTSIPTGMYWAIVTMTTVGYGDITPQTALGKTISSFMMLLGWGILAVPTGIVTAEMTARRNGARREDREPLDCHGCGSDVHDRDARFCKRCGGRLVRIAPASEGPYR